MPAKKYEVKQTLIVNHEGKNYSILSGSNREIPDELFDNWFVKAHVKSGNISEMGAISSSIEGDPDSIAAERNRIITETKVQAEEIIAAAKSEADAIIAAAKEEAKILTEAAEEEAHNIIVKGKKK